MRVKSVTCAVAVAVFSAGVASAQGWHDYISRDEFFLVSMPSEPHITTTTYRAASGARLPAKQFVATDGQRRYTVTVVHYMNASPADEAAAVEHAVRSFRTRGSQVWREILAPWSPNSAASMARWSPWQWIVMRRLRPLVLVVDDLHEVCNMRVLGRPNLRNHLFMQRVLRCFVHSACSFASIAARAASMALPCLIGNQNPQPSRCINASKSRTNASYRARRVSSLRIFSSCRDTVASKST